MEKKQKSLIIVESPAKAKTIKGYVGRDFNVAASLGHIKDLPKNSLGVEIENDFKPEFVVIKGKDKIIKSLCKLSQVSEKVFLASDPDREGEAIAWHIAEEIKKINPNIYRVLFHEITKSSILIALKNPETLNPLRYESQLTRRILDRLVGYEISPLLWEKVLGGLSAGRVQSVALRMVVEREEEISAFKSEEYFVISAELKGKEGNFTAKLWGRNGEKITIKNKEDAERIIEELKAQEFFVSSFEKKDKEKFPPPPFITSSLQQDSGRLFYFSAKKTMQIAQKLYEGKSIGNFGTHGLITYMRTDSVRVSFQAISAVRKFIKKIFGEKYLPAKANFFKNKKLSQDAHEAIRPTNLQFEPYKIKQYLSQDELKIYEIIFNRFIASQMSPAIFENTEVEIVAGEFNLSATSSTLKFDGFLKLYKETEEKEEKEKIPLLEKGEKLELIDLKATQMWTKPPPRYTESSLIKQLEDKGIGRPSTYAVIVSTIQEKKYVIKDKGRLIPTELGKLVTKLLISHFTQILDYDFTAKMEEGLDEIEEGKEKKNHLLSEFYKSLSSMLEKAKQKMKNLKKEAEITDILCDKCNRAMAVRIGKNGFFLACTGYPSCKNTREFQRDEKGNIVLKEKEIIGEVCEKCASPMIIKAGKFGRFLACSSYPSCKFTKALILEFPCPIENCDGKLVEKKGKKGKIFYGCSKYPQCKFITAYKPFKWECKKCGFPVLFQAIFRGKRRLICLREKMKIKTL